MKMPKRYLLTYIWTWAFDIIMWIAVMLIRVTSGENLHWNNGLWCEIRKNSRLYKSWAVRWAGLTLGHGGLLGPGYAGEGNEETDVEFHEGVHVEQYEASMLFSFILGIVMLLSGSVWWVCVLTWLLGGAAAYCAALLQAYLRGENPYMGNHFEESAYSQTENRE